MAIIMALYGFRVNAVCPGYIQIPMSVEIDSPEFTQKFVDKYIPINRPDKVEEIAPIFLFWQAKKVVLLQGKQLLPMVNNWQGKSPK